MKRNICRDFGFGWTVHVNSVFWFGWNLKEKTIGLARPWPNDTSGHPRRSPERTGTLLPWRTGTREAGGMESTIASPTKLTSEIQGHGPDQGKMMVPFLTRKGGIGTGEDDGCRDCSLVYVIQKADQTTRWITSKGNGYNEYVNFTRSEGGSLVQNRATGALAWAL